MLRRLGRLGVPRRGPGPMPRPCSIRSNLSTVRSPGAAAGQRPGQGPSSPKEVDDDHDGYDIRASPALPGTLGLLAVAGVMLPVGATWAQKADESKDARIVVTDDRLEVIDLPDVDPGQVQARDPLRRADRTVRRIKRLSWSPSTGRSKLRRKVEDIRVTSTTVIKELEAQIAELKEKGELEGVDRRPDQGPETGPRRAQETRTSLRREDDVARTARQITAKTVDAPARSAESIRIKGPGNHEAAGTRYAEQSAEDRKRRRRTSTRRQATRSASSAGDARRRSDGRSADNRRRALKVQKSRRRWTVVRRPPNASTVKPKALTIHAVAEAGEAGGRRGVGIGSGSSNSKSGSRPFRTRSTG